MTVLSPNHLPETPAVLEVRHAVRRWLDAYAPAGVVSVGLSGGADSLALLAATVVEGSAVHAIVVDHQLQPESGAVALAAAEHARRLGATVEVCAVEVGSEGGVEAAARSARYEALDRARQGLPVLLGHTLDDQAETVLLGLARGSGPRSIWGMRANDPPWGRPLLSVRRQVTRQVCADLGLQPHEDPHDLSSVFTRVRVRHEVLPLLEDVLGGGVAEALCRTVDQLRDDGAVLDEMAEKVLADALIDGDLSIRVLEKHPPALRRRVIRLWLLGNGARNLRETHVRAADRLISDWRGQGGVAVGGGTAEARLVAARKHGTLTLCTTRTLPKFC